MSLYSVRVPPTRGMPSYAVTVKATMAETKEVLALRQYNAVLKRNGNPPRFALPKGTTFTMLKDKT
jgi:hypothetical protein